MSDFPIFANHAHLYPAGTRPGASLDDLKRLLDECGIEKCVCFAPFPDRLEELTGGRESLKWIENEIRNEPAPVGFGTPFVLSVPTWSSAVNVPVMFMLPRVWL